MSRGGILDSPVCLNAGGRYFVDVIFSKQPGSDGTSSSHILIDSVRKSSSVHQKHSLIYSSATGTNHSRCVSVEAVPMQSERSGRERNTFNSVCLTDIKWSIKCYVFKCVVFIFQMGLIPRIESVQDFCSQSDLDSYRRFRCIGLAAELSPQESLPEVCEGLINSMSARINNGAVRE